MHELLIIIAVLLALTFLFPAAALRVLQSLQSWLARRRATADHESAELEGLLAAHDAWVEQVARLRRHLRDASNNKDRALLVTQTLAAGERFLQRADCHTVPRLYAQTERLCDQLRAHRTYYTQHAQHKKRGQAFEA